MDGVVDGVVDGVGIMGCCEVETVRVHFQRGINVYIFYKEGFRSSFSTKRDLDLHFLQRGINV